MNAFASVVLSISSLLSSWGGIPEPSLLYVREPGYRPVALEMARGRDAAALAALEAFVKGDHGPIGAEEREGLDWLEAHLQVRTGRLDEAEDALGALSERAGVFASEARMSLGALRSKQGRMDEALSAWDSVLPWSRHVDEAAEAALKLLLERSKDGPGDRARVRFDRLLQATGEPRALRSLAGVPTSWWPAGEETSPPGKKTRQTLADFRAEVKKRGLTRTLRHWKKGYGARSAIFLLVDAVGRADRKKPKQTSKRFAKALAPQRSSGYRAVATDEWIRVALDYDDPAATEALALYEGYRLEHLSTPGAGRTANRVVRTLLAADRFPEAIKIANELTIAQPHNSETIRMTFDIGVASFAAGETLNARSAFAAVLRAWPLRLTDGAVTWEEKALYWLARVDLLERKPSQATAKLKALVARYPLSYYVLLARDLVASSGGALDVLPGFDDKARGALRPAGPLPSYLVLQDLSLNLEAHGALFASLRERQPLPARDLAWFLWLDPLLGRRTVVSVTKALRGIVPVSLDSAPRAFLERLYNLPFADEVQAAARRVRISPWLLAALAWKESGFVESARSGVGALGLVQLMPRVARYVIDEHPLSITKTIREMRAPRNNLTIGAVYLKSLLAGFENTVLAVLAYNVGPGRVSRYLERYPNIHDADLLVERMSSRGGRDFVIKVCAAGMAYAYIYAGEELRISRRITARPREIPIIRRDDRVASNSRHPR